jgi:hypothetical protein
VRPLAREPKVLDYAATKPAQFQQLGCARSGAIFQLRFAGLARAVDAAKDFSVNFNAVSDDPAVAMRANRRQRVDGALKAIEGVTLPADDHFKRLVIFVFANLTCSHTQIFRAP